MVEGDTVRVSEGENKSIMPGNVIAHSRVEQSAMEGQNMPGLDMDGLKAAQAQDLEAKTSKGEVKKEVEAAPAESRERGLLDLGGNDDGLGDAGGNVGGDAAGDGGTGDVGDGVDVSTLDQPKSASHWKELKAKHQRELGELKGQLDALKSQSGVPSEEVEGLKRQLEEYREIVRGAALDRDPEFNREFDVQRKVAIDAAKGVSGDLSEQVERLMKEPSSVSRDERIDDLIKDMSPAAQRRVHGALQQLDQVELSRRGAVEAAKQNWDSRNQQIVEGQQREAQQRQSKLNSTFESYLSQLKSEGETGHFAYQVKEGDESSRGQVDQAIAVAKEVISGSMEPERLVKAALQVGAAGAMYGKIEALGKENAELRQKLSNVQSKTPGSGSLEKGKVQAGTGQFGDSNYNDNYFINELKKAQSQ